SRARCATAREAADWPAGRSAPPRGNWPRATRHSCGPGSRASPVPLSPSVRRARDSADARAAARGAGVVETAQGIVDHQLLLGMGASQETIALEVHVARDDGCERRFEAALRGA